MNEPRKDYGAFRQVFRRARFVYLGLHILFLQNRIKSLQTRSKAWERHIKDQKVKCAEANREYRNMASKTRAVMGIGGGGPEWNNSVAVQVNGKTVGWALIEYSRHITTSGRFVFVPGKLINLIPTIEES